MNEARKRFNEIKCVKHVAHRAWCTGNAYYRITEPEATAALPSYPSSSSGCSGGNDVVRGAGHLLLVDPLLLLICCVTLGRWLILSGNQFSLLSNEDILLSSSHEGSLTFPPGLWINLAWSILSCNLFVSELTVLLLVSHGIWKVSFLVVKHLRPQLPEAISVLLKGMRMLVRFFCFCFGERFCLFASSYIEIVVELVHSTEEGSRE